ncbi:unnamed protein product, partial [Polarella glacialis]
LRMMRAFRVFRLFKRVKPLNKLMVSLAKAVPGVVNAFFILLLVMSIYAILAVDFFMDYGEGGHYSNEHGESVEMTTPRGNDFGFDYFGNFGKSLFTLFQVLTGDSWSEVIARPMLHSGISITYPLGVSFFFVSFVIVNTLVLINVVVSVLLEKMVDGPVPNDRALLEDEDEESESDDGNEEITSRDPSKTDCTSLEEDPMDTSTPHRVQRDMLTSKTSCISWEEDLAETDMPHRPRHALQHSLLMSSASSLDAEDTEDTE